jgi:hypothetical protein
VLTLRRLDAEGWRSYLSELRPRFLTFRLVTGNVRIAWGVPLWALEQAASLLLRSLPLLPHLAPLLPGRARRALAGWDAGSQSALIAALDLLLSEPWHDLLRLPPGEPFVSVETDDVFLEIRQI